MTLIMSLLRRAAHVLFFDNLCYIKSAASVYPASINGTSCGKTFHGMSIPCPNAP